MGPDYPAYDGEDPDGQVCPAHPRSDRPWPHLAKWRIWHETTGAMFVDDPANADLLCRLWERERRLAART
jgi:hypothetical protein